MLAQMVEHRTFNPVVVGSIPTHPTKFIKIYIDIPSWIIILIVYLIFHHLDLHPNITHDIMRSLQKGDFVATLIGDKIIIPSF